MFSAVFCVQFTEHEDVECCRQFYNAVFCVQFTEHEDAECCRLCDADFLDMWCKEVKEKASFMSMHNATQNVPAPPAVPPQQRCCPISGAAPSAATITMMTMMVMAMVIVV